MRPVLLATLDVPFDEEAAAVAVDAAVETGQPLIVANCVQLPPLVLSVLLGYDQLDDPELTASIRRPVDLAAALGVQVEWLRVRSFHPVDALLTLVAERTPGLLVFGPDRRKLRRRAYRVAARAVSRRASCLVWLAS
jgi:Universal stress protein family